MIKQASPASFRRRAQAAFPNLDSRVVPEPNRTNEEKTMPCPFFIRSSSVPSKFHVVNRIEPKPVAMQPLTFVNFVSIK